MLKYVILYLEKLNQISDLHDFLLEMAENHVIVYELNEDVTEVPPLDESILITDRKEGAWCARELKVGYLLYETEANRLCSFADAVCIIQGFDGIDYEFMNHMYERSRGIPWKIFETERCLVREITVEDLKRLYEIYEDPSITAYMEGLYPNPKDEEEFTRAYIERMYGFYGFGLWIVEEKREGLIIGRAGISIRDGFEDLELGYLIAKTHQGQGYAYEVCSAIIEYAHNKLGCEKMNAFIDARNEPSIRLCEKLGFRHIGQSRIERKLLERYQLIYKDFVNYKKTV